MIHSSQSSVSRRRVAWLAITTICLASSINSSPLTGQYEIAEKPYVRAMKRSMALGRLEFRPGKRAGEPLSFEQSYSNDMTPSFESFQNWLRPTRRIQSAMYVEPLTVEEVETYPSTFSLLSEAQMGKRSMAVGRSGFRPGKRSIATGREGFRPGKRAAFLPYLPFLL